MKRLVTLAFLFLAIFVNAQTANDIRNIDGLVAWYSADSVHLTADNHVDTLYDKSGNGFNVIQTSNDAQPTLFDNAFNENPSIVFDGNDYLNGGDICDLGPNGTSIFIVGKSNKKSGCFVAKSKAASANMRYAVYYENNLCFIYNNTTLSKPLDFGDYKVLQAFLNPDSSACSLIANGNQLGEFNTNAVDMNSTFDFLVGGYNNSGGTVPPYASLGLDGEIAEIIIFNHYLSSADSLMVLNFLRDKYSGVNLHLDDINVNYGFAPIEYTAECDWAQSFVWDDSIVSPTITISDSKPHSLTVTDKFGFTYTDTLKINYQTPSLPTDIFICSGEKATLDATVQGDYTYLWNNGSMQPISETTKSGIFYVTITDTNGYHWISDTINVVSDDFSSIKLFGNDTSLCKGDSIAPNLNIDNKYAYLWSTNSHECKIAVNTDGKYSLTVTNENGCIAKDSIYVRIKGIVPDVKITADTAFANESTSFKSMVNISDGSQIIEYKWLFGDGDTGFSQNPTHKYKEPGTYSATLAVTTTSGCNGSSALTAKVMYDRNKLISPVYPIDNQRVFADSVVFKWKPIKDCERYFLQIATSSDFDTLVFSGQTNKTDTTINEFIEGETYYWRIRSIDGTFGPSYMFTVSSLRNINGLVAWFSADSVHLNADNHVDTLYDKSRNRFNVIQTLNDAQPTLSENMLNGNPSIVFDGNDYLNGGDVCDLGPNGASIFVVGKSNKKNGCFVAKSLAGGVPLRYGIFYENNLCFIYNNTTLSNPLTFGEYKILQAFVNTDSSLCSLIANGNNLGVISTSTTDMNSTFDFLVGGYNNSAGSIPPYAALGLDGEIAEIIIFNRCLNHSDSLMVLDYIRNKYSGVQLNIGKDIRVDYGFTPIEYTAVCDWAQSFLWDDGNETPSITISDSKKHYLTVTDKFGFKHSDYIQVDYPKIGVLTDTLICLGDTITWAPDLSGPYSYRWSDGSTGNELTIATEGKYWVVITDTAGYEWHSDTIFVKVDRFSQQMTLGADTINTCIGNNIYLQSGFDEATRYQWSDGTTADHLVVKSAGSYSVTASNLRGCIGHDTAHINTMGTAPTVGFDNSTLCATRQIAFTDKSSSNDSGKITSYHWDFGDGGISSAMNPAHIYDTSGNFQISYTISCENGCSNILKKNIYVNALPKADFSTSQACSNAPTRFTSTSTTANGYLTSWQWNINDSTYGIQNPQATFTQYGRHTIELIVTANNGCTDTLHRDIDILQGPEVDFTYSAPCFDSPIYLTNNSKTILGLSSSYTWKSDTAIFSTQKSPSITYKDTTTHQVTLTIKQIANGCISSLTKEIRVMPNPVPSILTGKICEGQDAILEGYNLEHASISKKWLWTIDSLQFTGEHRTSRTFGAKGKHKISLQITDSAGCVATFDTTVSVHETPTATFRPLSTRGPVPFQTEFTNTSANADSLLWIFGDGEESTDIDVCHTYHTDGIYNVQLIASNSFCSDTAQQVIEAIYPQIDIVLVSASAKTDNGQIAVSAVVANRSNYDIPNVSILWYDNVGHRISETIADTIKQGKIVQYEFVAKIGEARPDRIQYICVSAEPSTAYTDDTPSDNEYCIIFNKDEFSVCQPMPNPAKDKLAISYILPNDGNVRIELYNHNGGKIGNLYDSQASAGYNVHNFDVSTLNPGIYFYRITSGNESKTQMLIIER